MKSRYFVIVAASILLAAGGTFVGLNAAARPPEQMSEGDNAGMHRVAEGDNAGEHRVAEGYKAGKRWVAEGDNAGTRRVAEGDNAGRVRQA